MISKTLLGALVGAILLIGCGGGGSVSTTGGGTAGGGTAGGGGGGGAVNLFLTDDLNTGIDHLWVSVKKIEMIGNTKDITVFNDPNGTIVDIRGQNVSGVPHFALMGLGAVDSETFSGVKITIGSNITVVPTGSSTGESRTVGGANGLADFSYTTGSPHTISSGTSIVVDFDLAHWVDNGTKVVTSFKVGPTSGLDDLTRMTVLDFQGTVSSLSGTAPNQSFDLTDLRGFQIQCSTDSNTIVLNSTGATSPSIANGKFVTVRGKFVRATRVLDARVVKIRPPHDQDTNNAVAVGTVTAGSTTGITQGIGLTLTGADGFLPPGRKVSVGLKAATVYFDQNGKVVTKGQFFATSSFTLAAEAVGSYDPSTQILTATRVRVAALDDSNTPNHSGELMGSATGSDTAKGTVTLQLTGWQGFSLEANQSITVSTTSKTTYSINGNASDKASFFSHLTVGTAVTAEGAWTDAGFVATSLAAGPKGP